MKVRTIAALICAAACAACGNADPLSIPQGPWVYGNPCRAPAQSASQSNPTLQPGCWVPTAEDRAAVEALGQ